MARNILIFADGTGNEGGLIPDESRTTGLQFWACHSITAAAVVEAKVRGLARLIDGSIGPASRPNGQCVFLIRFSPDRP